MNEDNVKFGKYSVAGIERDMNQDDCAILNSSSKSSLKSGVVVSDGMGGGEMGEMASRLAVETIQNDFHEWVHKNFTKSHELEDELKLSFKKANLEIETKSKSTSQTIGCTLSTILIFNQEFVFGHVGDSRIYLLRNKKLTQLSTDHSVNKKLTRRIGKSSDIIVDTDAVPIQNGDIVFLCSDGINDLVSDDEIQKGLLGTKTVNEACVELVKLARYYGGYDDMTTVAMEIGDLERSEDDNQAFLLILNKAETESLAHKSLKKQDSKKPGKNLLMALAAAIVLLIIMTLFLTLNSDKSQNNIPLAKNAINKSNNTKSTNNDETKPIDIVKEIKWERYSYIYNNTFGYEIRVYYADNKAVSADKIIIKNKDVFTINMNKFKNLKENSKYYYEILPIDNITKQAIEPDKIAGSVQKGEFYFDLVNQPPSQITGLHLKRNNDNNHIISWNNSKDPDPLDTVSYKINSTCIVNNNEINIFYETKNNSYTFSDLKENSLCKILVRGTDNRNGYGIWSKPLNLIVNNKNDPPSIPMAIKPFDNNPFNPFTDNFKWSKSKDPDPNDNVKYTIQIALDKSFLNLIIDKNNIEKTFFSTSEFKEVSKLKNSETYFWRVMASDLAGSSSEYCKTMKFKAVYTENTPLAANVSKTQQVLQIQAPKTPALVKELKYSQIKTKIENNVLIIKDTDLLWKDNPIAGMEPQHFIIRISTDPKLAVKIAEKRKLAMLKERNVKLSKIPGNKKIKPGQKYYWGIKTTYKNELGQMKSTDFAVCNQTFTIKN